MCSSDVFLGFLAILFPPLPVWVKCGICSADSIINICLCVLGVIPGLLHAWYIIAKFPEPAYEYEPVNQHGGEEGGRVTYVFVNGPPPRQQQPTTNNNSASAKTQSQTHHGAAMNYGTSSSSHQQGQGQGPSNAGEGSSDGAAPPSYAAAVKGDNKIQTTD